MRALLTSTVGLWLLVCASKAPAKPGSTVLPTPQHARIARLFARRFPEAHLSQQPLDDTISGRAWTNYLAALDFERVYFTADDIGGFRAERHSLDDDLQAGNLGFAYRVFHIYKQRVRDRCGYVDELLERGFDVERDEVYRWKRRDAPWPRDDEEYNELWRQRVKNEYVRQRVAFERTEDDPAETGPAATNRPPEKAQSPEAFIRKRYEQMLTVLDDNDSEWVLQNYLSAFAHAYDPHSGYMSPSAVADFNIEMKLSLVGIGALLRPEDGAAQVVRVIPGGPAARDTRDKRLQPGDRIIAVGQGDEEPVDVLHWPLYQIVKLIRGEQGTRVVLVVIPASDPAGSTTKTVDLVRDEVKLEEQSAGSETLTLEDGEGRKRTLGVIDLSAFYANMRVKSEAHPEFKSSSYDVAGILEDMAADGVEGVLLDLRNNGGGSLLEAINMTGLFIRAGPVVQVKERERRRPRILYDRNTAVAYDGPLVVLVNRLSASASEIVAGALRDYGRAVVVGDSKTHGKGTVQSVIALGRDDSYGSLKVTSAKYYRINGSSTQLRGVEPDILLPSVADFMDFGEDRLRYPIAWSRVDRAPYLPVRDLNPTVEELRRRSKKRRGGDPRFAAYEEILEHVQRMTTTREMPLHIEQRRQFARAERKLSDLQDKLARDNGEQTPGPAGKDLVLEEALRILADLAALQEKPPADAPPASPGASPGPPEAAAAPRGRPPAGIALALLRGWPTALPLLLLLASPVLSPWFVRRRNET